MKKQTKLLILTLLLLLPSSARTQNLITYSVISTTMTPLLNEANPNSLVLINIDDTVITPKAKMFRYNSPYRTFINDLINLAKEKPAFNKQLQIWYLQRQVTLVESAWPDFIASLKNAGAVVYGLIKMDPAAYRLIKNPADWRINELQAFNIRFTEKLGGQEFIKLRNLDGEYSFFYKGIIFTGPFTKLETIIDFLRISNLNPTRLVLVDSDKEDIKRVGYRLKNMSIIYQSVNYLGERNMEGTPNPETIKIQQDNLLYFNRWLEDEEVDKEKKK